MSMTIAEFSEWLSATSISQFIQVTNGLISSLQTVHIIAIAVLFASALMVDLRILGSGLKSESLRAVADRFIPSIWVCLVVLLLTGALLITAEPGRTLSNPSFYLKMISLLLAIIVTLWLRSFARGSKPVTALPVIAALVSLLLWMTIIVTGRYIAYTT
jgi:hypothetical protein